MNDVLPLHTLSFSRRTTLNRLFAVVYTSAILALLYRHALAIIHCSSMLFYFMNISLFISDFVLAFMWCTTQSFRMRPVVGRQQFPENLFERKDFPMLDIFICTADPYKEPPMSVVNTALSVMAYDYPTEKISVYVSDDGGSELTLFAFLGAAKFGRHWLPFCRKYNLVERCPEAYFSSNYPICEETNAIKIMYENMKLKVENVMEKGVVSDEYVCSPEEVEVFSQWKSTQHQFTRQQHPSVIKVLLESGKGDRDATGHAMPNLIYVSRQKSKTYPHYFKAGALNVLLRVSAVMTNAPIILTLDCDMYSNDPQTPCRALCYLSDPSLCANLGFVQFPQRFHGLNEVDTYACEHLRLFILNPIGMDGLSGPCYVGTGCFFNRRAFFGCPSTFLSPEIEEVSPYYIVNRPISSSDTLDLAHRIAGCSYENQTKWGSKMGFRYGSMVEDYYTGYKLHCEGWKSIFCHPERPAFLGDIPISLDEMMNQNRRWIIGLIQVGLSKCCPITYGIQKMGPLMALSYAHYSFWAFWSIPITIYALLPQLALLNGISIFPEVSNTWLFFLYVFLFVGAYGQDCLDFLSQGTLHRWWSDQRMWLLKGLTSYLFGLIEHLSNSLGIVAHGFNVTSKVIDDQQRKRYDQCIFDFGVPSPMLVPLTMAAIVNLIAFIFGLLLSFKSKKGFEELFIQVFIAGFAVLNCLPIYEAIFLRTDRGRMPTRIPIVSSSLVCLLCLAVYFIQK